jgi:hypothetical protein
VCLCAGDAASTYPSAQAGIRLALRDANAAVVARAAEAAGLLASRLRGGRASSLGRATLPLLADRLKEKRGPVLTSSLAALRRMVRWEALSLEELVEEVSPVVTSGAAAGPSSATMAKAKQTAPEHRRNALQLLGSIIASVRVLPPAQLSAPGSANADRVDLLGGLLVNA